MTTDDHKIAMTIRCVVEDSPFDDDPDTTTSWIIERSEGRPLSPAGVADITWPLLGITAAFDYARPSVLMSVELTPVALRRLRDDDGLTAALTAALLGDPTRLVSLADGPYPPPALAVDETRTWRSLGRLAVQRTMLERQARPSDGLWAAEAALMLWDLDRRLGPLSRDLIAVAGPALAALPEHWSGQLHEELLAHLDRLRALAQEVGQEVRGPFTKARELVAGKGLRDTIGSLDVPREVQPQLPAYLGAMAGAVAGRTDEDLPSFLGGRNTKDQRFLSHDRDEGSNFKDEHEPDPHVVFDHSVPLGLLVTDKPTLTVADDVLDLVIEVASPSAPASVVQRCLVSVIGPQGDLLSGATSMALRHGHLHGRFRLPRHRGTGQLQVVVHRDPSFWPGTREANDRRIVRRYAQDAVDAKRRNEATKWVDHLPADVALACQQAIVEADVYVFLAEHIAQQDGLGIEIPSDAEPESLDGVRSLALSSNRFDVAADAERAWLAGGSKTTLTPYQLDALVLRSSAEPAERLSATIDELDDAS